MLIIIPLPLFFAQTVFGVGGLTAWVVIGMIWAFCSAIAVVLYPLYESRQALLLICRGIVKVSGTNFSRSPLCPSLISTCPIPIGYFSEGKWEVRASRKDNERMIAMKDHVTNRCRRTELGNVR